PVSNPIEKQRAEYIAENCKHTFILPTLNLHALAFLLQQSKAVVAVDTGLAHLAAALNCPTISIYGPTNAKLTGTEGLNQFHMQSQFPCSPCLQDQCSYSGVSLTKPACFDEMTPKLLWKKLHSLLGEY